MAAEAIQDADGYRYRHVSMDVLKHDFRFESGPGPGEAMPELNLTTTDRESLNTLRWKSDRPVLFVFGSVSCPMTASSMEALKRLHGAFGKQVAFVMLNVREAHPGENVPQPDTAEEKLAHAVALKERFDIPWTVATDDVEGAVHRALDPKPNAAYLVDAQGIIAFRSLWAGDEEGISQALASVVRGEIPRERESQRRLVPMTMGLGEMRQALRRSGPTAERDMWRAAPPMAAMAWLADLFRPLAPLTRGFAAMGLMMLMVLALIVLVAGLVFWLV